MSQNIDQIFIANPASSMLATDLLYLGRSPYGTTDDFAITFANFVASIGTATPTASTIAQWDANKNFSANNFIEGYQAIATAAGTTTLTVASPFTSQFTGTTTQTVVMPVVSTLVLNQSYLLVNSSTGTLTVNSSGGNLIQTMAAGTSLLLFASAITGTTAASWTIVNYNTSDITIPLPISSGGTGVASVTTTPTASAWAGWDANKNLSANNFLPGFQSIATAGTTTTLNVASPFITQFTGSTTQTVVMPVVATLAIGTPFIIINASTGALTVNSSGGQLIQTMAAGTTLELLNPIITGTTAASWQVLTYNTSDITFPLALNLGGTNNTLTANNGGIVYSNATQLAILAGTATANQVMLSGANTTPAWSTATYPATTTINQILYSSAANTITGITSANNGVFITSNTGVPSVLANSATPGFVFTANSGAPPSWQASTTTNFPAVVVSGTSQAMAVDTIYISNNAGLVTLTLPATAAVGTIIYMSGLGAGGWKIAQNASQNIKVGNATTTTGVGGSLASTGQFDTIALLNVVANTTWVALGAPQSAGLTIV